MQHKKKGGFTLPGEAGYEALTLELANRWGADVIRDSDGTALSDEILNAGYDIYSTICIIRDHNEWAKRNPDKLQMTFLMTQPVVAAESELAISLMQDFFAEQFAVSETPDSLRYWQVFDRTTGNEVPREKWTYDSAAQRVLVHGAALWHTYTVSFLAYRIWEEISMYNHTTNNWDKEHLMQIDPIYPETQEYLLNWLENWCLAHPATNVIRFTSMFYNFVWIWGSSEKNRHLFTDWASYDFTVSTRALDLFAERYGYRLTAEDFVNKGKLRTTHTVPDQHKLDWMAFINDFVIEYGKKLIDIAHKHNKLAYVFYDDSWVGIEPYNGRFAEFGFDGIIKCVFSGFEARLGSGVEGVKTHELRLHPYLFPVGLGGLPTFMEGGDPTLDAKKFWNNIRRALLRAPVDRIGLGGYLHLVEPYPDFVDYIEKIADEFRLIRDLHADGKPYALKPKVAVLTAWGKLRSWTCSGHYHEQPGLDLINVLESLSGLPFEVEFLNFDEIRNGVPDGIQVIINAGTAGSAWSGGELWNDPSVIEALTGWVYSGGVFLGINEPSAAPGQDRLFRMAPVLGLDKDTGERISHGKWPVAAQGGEVSVPGDLTEQKGLYLTDGKAQVLAEQNGSPLAAVHDFGSGRGVYLSSYTHSVQNARLLMDLILHAAKQPASPDYVTDNAATECAYYPASSTLIIINNSDAEQTASVRTDKGTVTQTLAAYDTVILKV
ncbi:1,3-beta-galactosyl-N-acetylhexosamine phosphorylase [Gorillibacterium sp. sgz5001074]|uniref:1,3-beta-galactosyl-N-acetylhexosamine phosphorylase n=1 Tax=Gorillibacterium sp. sgz5001074 TaxID=3446695 RepID=UPI003F68102D